MDVYSIARVRFIQQTDLLWTHITLKVAHDHYVVEIMHVTKNTVLEELTESTRFEKCKEALDHFDREIDRFSLHPYNLEKIFPENMRED